MKVRIITYNIHGGRGTDGIRDFARIGEFLKKQNIDVALLQEVNTLSAKYNADRDIAALMAGHFQYIANAPTRWSTHGWYGNAVLSKFPISKKNIIDISAKGREPRNILEVFIEIPRGQLHVVNTHKGLGYFERGRQMRKLNEVLSRKSEVPLVVGGDINEWQLFSAGLRCLNESLCALPIGPTFPTACPLFHLDRFWCRPAGSVKSLGVLKTKESRIFSDHYPAVVELDLGE